MQNQKNVNFFIIARFSKTHLSSQYKYIFFENNIQEILLNSFFPNLNYQEIDFIAKLQVPCTKIETSLSKTINLTYGSKKDVIQL